MVSIQLLQLCLDVPPDSLHWTLREHSITAPLLLSPTCSPPPSAHLLLQWEHLDISRPLSTKDFDATLHRYPIVVINFYAPWCPFCKRMEPSWESASRTVHDRYPEGSDGRIRFAKVCDERAYYQGV